MNELCDIIESIYPNLHILSDPQDFPLLEYEFKNGKVSGKVSLTFNVDEEKINLLEFWVTSKKPLIRQLTK